MRKSKMLILTICLAVVFVLTGCGAKKSITASDFEKRAEKNDYEVYDISDQYSSIDYIEKVIVAKTDDWQVEFYQLSDEEHANGMFKTNQKKFETMKGKASAGTSSSMANYSMYKLSSNDEYMYLSRIDDTFLYLKVDSKYKDKVVDFVKELGY